MKRIYLAGLAVVLVGTAWAEPPKSGAACVDPHRSYIAQPLNSHDVYVKQSIGAPKPAIRVSTSCTHLQPALGVGFSSSFSCIDLGDWAVASVIGGRPQKCRVTKVVPYVPQDGDIKTY